MPILVKNAISVADPIIDTALLAMALTAANSTSVGLILTFMLHGQADTLKMTLLWSVCHNNYGIHSSAIVASPLA